MPWLCGVTVRSNESPPSKAPRVVDQTSDLHSLLTSQWSSGTMLRLSANVLSSNPIGREFIYLNNSLELFQDLLFFLYTLVTGWIC